MAKEISIKELTSEQTATGKDVREHLTRGKETFKVDFDKIKVRKGWNVRTDYGDIDGLAASILENGLQNPLKGDLLPDGTFVLSDGHRRHKAIELLNKTGSDYGKVDVVLNAAKATDESRLIQMWVANDSKELTAIEKAEVCKRLTNLGYKPQDIAQKFGISRMQVDNYLTMAGLSIEEKQAIQEGTIKPTAAVKLAKKVKSADERKKIIKSAKESGKTVKQKNIEQSTAADLADECLKMLKQLDKMVDADGQDLIFEIDKRLRDIKKITK